MLAPNKLRSAQPSTHGYVVAVQCLRAVRKVANPHSISLKQTNKTTTTTTTKTLKTKSYENFVNSISESIDNVH